MFIASKLTFILKNELNINNKFKLSLDNIKYF